MIFRIEKNNNYTVLSNYHLRDKKMSLKAKGLLSWMLSNTDDWDYSIAGIVANCKESETAIRSTLKELQDFGYLQIIKKNPNTEISTIHYEYIIHERSILTNSQEGDFLGLENQDLENTTQINTNTRNTNKEDSNLSKDKLHENSPKTDFLRSGTKTSSRPTLYSRCIHHIDMFTDNREVRERLVLFLNSISEMKKLKGETQFVGILKKLEGFTVEEQLRMIDYSIEKGYGTFYKNTSSPRAGKTGHASIDIEGLDYTQMTRATPEQKKQFREDIANGRAEKF